MRSFEGARGPLVLGAGIFAISWAAIFVRLADQAPALTIAAYRMLIAGGILGLFAAWALATRRDARPNRRGWLLLGLSGALLAGHFWSWFASLERTSVGSSVVIVTMQPVFAGLMGYAAFRERPSRGEWYGIGLAMAGFVVIGAHDVMESGVHVQGDLLALLGGVLLAGYRTIGRGMRSDLSATTYSGIVYVAAAVCLWAMVATVRPDVDGFEAQTWTFIVLLALVPQIAGHTAVNWALGRYRVVTIGLAALGEPVIATVLAAPILDEPPTSGVLLGGPLVMAGVVLGLRSAATERPVAPLRGAEDVRTVSGGGRTGQR